MVLITTVIQEAIIIYCVCYVPGTVLTQAQFWEAEIDPLATITIANFIEHLWGNTRILR